MAVDKLGKGIIVNIAVIGAALGLGRVCNSAFNDRTVEAPGYVTVSYSTGLNGHVEYTSFADGSQEAKVYPNLGHRMSDSMLYQDLDSDGLVDRIRESGPEWKFHRNTLLVREFDEAGHDEDFSKADALLKELMERYPPQR